MFNPLYFTFAFYIILMLAIGVIAYFATRNFSDFILGGRRLGSFVTALSAGASDMSGWLLLGLPGAIYAVGLSESWIAIGLTVGAYLNWLLVAGRLRVQTEFYQNASTLPQYFYMRFGQESIWIKVASSAIILLFFTIYCASGIVAGAKLFQSLFHISYHEAIWYGAGATIAYTFIGGFLAVSWTDTVQATLMFFALIVTPVFAYFYFGNGAEAFTQAVHQVAAGSHGLFSGVTFVGIVSAMAWGLGYFGQPHILTRFMAATSKEAIVNARRIGMTWMIICLAGAVAVGYVGIAYFQGDNALGGHAETVFIRLVEALFNPWLAGILLSAILAAVMSTLSCQLIVSAAAISEDFYKGFIRMGASQREMVWIGRLMVLVVAGIAIALAWQQDSSVLNIVAYAWAGFGAAFGPVILLGCFSRKISNTGAMVGMVAGAVTVVVWKQLGTGLYEIVPGFIVCWIVTYLVSLMKPPKNQVVEDFNKVDDQFHDRV